jgi:hypothetical protein
VGFFFCLFFFFFYFVSDLVFSQIVPFIMRMLSDFWLVLKQEAMRVIHPIVLVSSITWLTNFKQYYNKTMLLRTSRSSEIFCYIQCTVDTCITSQQAWIHDKCVLLPYHVRMWYM